MNFVALSFRYVYYYLNKSTRTTVTNFFFILNEEIFVRFVLYLPTTIKSFVFNYLMIFATLFQKLVGRS